MSRNQRFTGCTLRKISNRRIPLPRICFRTGFPKNYDYESIQISACRHDGRPHGAFGGLFRTVAAHNSVFVKLKSDDFIFHASDFIFDIQKADSGNDKAEQPVFLKQQFFPDTSDFFFEFKKTDASCCKTDISIIFFAVNDIQKHWQAGRARFGCVLHKAHPSLFGEDYRHDSFVRTPPRDSGDRWRYKTGLI